MSARGRIDDLVFDVGAHRGEDAAFYLAKGYRVVAVEADPLHVEHLRDRFAAELARGRLTLVGGAIAERGVEAVAFYRSTRNSSWGTTDGEWAERREQHSGFERVEVPAVEFAEILSAHGVPHFMKIDIEGADGLCLETLREFEERPRYLSIESDKMSWRALEAEFDVLESLGYGRFAVVQQASIPGRRIATVDVAGSALDFTFEPDSSGAFGEDVGPWLTRGRALLRYRGIFAIYKVFGEGGLLRRTDLGLKLAVKMPRVRGVKLPGWYDTHAALVE